MAEYGFFVIDGKATAGSAAPYEIWSALWGMV
jgi:hypothetical protein